jgi:hypothetical protein
MSTQNTITAVDAEAAELDATRAVYDMLKPLGCEAQTRVLDHVYLPASSASAETASKQAMNHYLVPLRSLTQVWGQNVAEHGHPRNKGA